MKEITVKIEALKTEGGDASMTQRTPLPSGVMGQAQFNQMIEPATAEFEEGVKFYKARYAKELKSYMQKLDSFQDAFQKLKRIEKEGRNLVAATNNMAQSSSNGS